MGQEAGKSAWTKPAGGYQTITGRRYGRRHAYVSFRPNTSKHRNPSNEDWQELRMNSVSAEPPISAYEPEDHKVTARNGNISSMLQAIFPVSPNSVHPELPSPDNKEAPSRKQPPVRINMDSSGSHKKKPKSKDPAAVDSAGDLSAEACGWFALEEEARGPPNPGVLSFVNIDSYEPESSEGEDELEMSIGLQNQGSDSLSERLHSFVWTTSQGAECTYLERQSERNDTQTAEAAEFCLTKCANGKTDCTSGGDIRPDEFEAHTARSSGPDVLRGAESTSTTSSSGNPGAEMVVRSKIRKQTNETRREKRRSRQADVAAGRAGSKGESDSAASLFLTQERLSTFLSSDLPHLCGGEELQENNGGSSTAQPRERDDLWQGLDDFTAKCGVARQDEDSSECSEGEWSSLWMSDSGADKERRSSEESWETLPDLGELPSNRASSPEDPGQLRLTPGEQTPLEEGEVPWVMYSEEAASSSDEDLDSMSHFVHPGLFILDSNNNVEDDSSVSEDLDTEWRLLDDFGEYFGMAQAISYVDPELLTYMALEERLAQAMEAALAHLESLSIDVEQAHPPASEQIIECLPQITVQEDQSGQEQCCAICCCEYVSDEIATQLPCHHMFHKLCVTLWLRKSGTCPVCRFVLTPALTEPPVHTSLISEQDSPPSSHNATGAR
ncbi:E3 ubiquitin-protein ligase Praja-2 isoform X2 [Denticeps clupeoides]|uniref:RING-type E3 ubiquitin transferase n=1 Tax=Denticeps clupeoides TaxID=299321 RepID=A0AAY4DWW0_9TELE|nr:E3 ubiquitin-protein ligase Praja-2 isoform X2 [Denticeps clupeoides]